MTEEPTRVLIVDDSALVRQVLEAVLSRAPGIEVVGTARDGTTALAAAERLHPHVITLDLEMPGMSGLDVLDRLHGRGAAVIVVASLREAARDLTVQALTRGAFDFIPKPTSIIDDLANVAAELVSKVTAARRSRAAARPAPRAGAAPPGAPKAATLPTPRGRPTDLVIAIGASTGGPEALAAVLSQMPADSPPIVIVQHMPEQFTAKFAQRLDGEMALRVKEAVDGDLVKPGLALIAPGTKYHMILSREAHGLVVRLHSQAPVMHHRPSVDILFQSCAETLGRRAVGVILTGMGSDGARGLTAMQRAGATTIAQDERTSLVFGMPMEAIALGGVTHVLPIDAIGAAALRLARGVQYAAA